MALIVVVVLVASVLAGWAVTVPLHGFREDDEGEGFAVTCPAACGRCGAKVGFGDVVPVRSWFGQARCCSACGAERGWSWIAPQAAIPVLAVITTLAVGPTGSLPVYVLFVVVLVVASVIDLRTMLIPRQVVWAGIVGGLALMVGAAVWTGDAGRLTGAIIGAGAYFALLLVSSLISPGGMGMGDVRLGALIGLLMALTGVGLAVGLDEPTGSAFIDTALFVVAGLPNFLLQFIAGIGADLGSTTGTP